MIMDTDLNPFSLSGNNFLITGAASGIGKATSILLSKMGANLILADIDREGLQETKKECRASDKTLALDLSKPRSIKDAVVESLEGFGKLHGFVHLAGKPYISPLKSISEEKCAEIYTLNTYSAIELAKVFTNRSVYAGERGSIVLVSSVYALVGSPANVGYAMSKAALHGVTRSLAMELAGKRIRVNCVAPGFVKTNMMGDTKTLFDKDHVEVLEKLHPLGLGEAGDVANAIAFLLSDGAKWITGSILSVDGGFTAQ
jgi:NAD(P)-dependent dehydrogenase (short-subunit alcohol dehydrogenase family)